MASSYAIGGPNYVSETNGKGFFRLANSEGASAIYVSKNDYVGVVRAATDLQMDIKKVADKLPNLVFDAAPKETFVVIAGTYGKNKWMDALVKNKKLDITEIANKWEAYSIQTIKNPFPGVAMALVIVGSDKRGTIFGIYDISQNIGVSPWHFWADAPVAKKSTLYVKPIKHHQKPAVKYRGYFINDEAPALSGWIEHTFANVPTSAKPPIGKGVANYGSAFYKKVFELMLRVRANYLWPAMWNNAFNEDDAQNAQLADDYGIVMGTSHQEPMLRAQQEWDRRYFKTLGHWNYKKHADTLVKFWREGVRRNKNYESIVTMGLRGANDSEMEGTNQENIAMVEEIVAKQQQILQQEVNPELEKVPQSWCLYKEVMEYYNDGMKIPDNITFLWADDNWGNIRRLPTPEERKRKGGSGVYYHFDYHGGPRSYEWINTNPIEKIWDQMALAYQYDAKEIWIVNVGHFKGYELPMEYFIDLAWNADTWTTPNTTAYTKQWATREFGAKFGDKAASILTKYTKFNGRRKPESLSTTTFSATNYLEAEKVVEEYQAITKEAQNIYDALPSETKDAFYQMVLFPTKASALVHELYFTAAKNNLYALQKRNTTNQLAAKTKSLFQQDLDLMQHYNTVYANGKWNHFMDQTHLGYTSWNPPKKNTLDAIDLKEIVVPEKAELGISLANSQQSWPLETTQASLPSFDNFANKKQYIEVFNKGLAPLEFKVTTNVPWIEISTTKGSLYQEEQRVYLQFNSDKVINSPTEGIVKVEGAGEEVLILVKISPNAKLAISKNAFIESDGVIAIEAAHFSKNTAVGTSKWIEIPNYGLTLSGMRATAAANAPAAIPLKNAACLEYPIHLFSENTVKIQLVTSPVLNFMPGRDCKIAVSLDDESPEYITIIPDKFFVHHGNPAWQKMVLDQAIHVQTTLKIPSGNFHILKVWMIDPGVVLEKIILDTGGLKNSYLGPNESFFNKKK